MPALQQLVERAEHLRPHRRRAAWESPRSARGSRAARPLRLSSRASARPSASARASSLSAANPALEHRVERRRQAVLRAGSPASRQLAAAVARDARRSTRYCAYCMQLCGLPLRQLVQPAGGFIQARHRAEQRVEQLVRVRRRRARAARRGGDPAISCSSAGGACTSAPASQEVTSSSGDRRAPQRQLERARRATRRRRGARRRPRSRAAGRGSRPRRARPARTAVLRVRSNGDSSASAGEPSARCTAGDSVPEHGRCADRPSRRRRPSAAPRARRSTSALARANAIGVDRASRRPHRGRAEQLGLEHEAREHAAAPEACAAPRSTPPAAARAARATAACAAHALASSRPTSFGLVRNACASRRSSSSGQLGDRAQPLEHLGRRGRPARAHRG